MSEARPDWRTAGWPILAQRHGGNALTGVRLDSNEVSQGGIVEIHCYGTAVVVGPRS